MYRQRTTHALDRLAARGYAILIVALVTLAIITVCSNLALSRATAWKIDTDAVVKDDSRSTR